MIGELQFERGAVAIDESIHRWTDKFGAGFAHRAPHGISTRSLCRCVANPMCCGAQSTGLNVRKNPNLEIL
ncbi:hypothetical protein P3T25_003429 [Paraburkholderia sp. GAS32]